MLRLTLMSAIAALAMSSHCAAAKLATPVAGSMASKGTPKLAAEWWQWAMSAADDESPVIDQTGAHCAFGQRGATWFLAGGYGTSKIRRTCTVPAGRSLFFPLVNMAYYPRQGIETITCADTKAGAALNNDTALDLFAELDGVAVTDLKQYRVRSSKCFNIFARVPAALKPYNAFPSATDGFWLLLKPLPAGRHTLKFGGRYNRDSPNHGRMVQDIEYELIVK
jgi:hypothetical protein